MNVESRCKRRYDVFNSAIKWNALQTGIRDVLKTFFLNKGVSVHHGKIDWKPLRASVRSGDAGFLEGPGVIIAAFRLYEAHLLSLRALYSRLCGTRIAPAQGYWETPLIWLTFLWGPKTAYHVGVPYIAY